MFDDDELVGALEHVDARDAAIRSAAVTVAGRAWAGVVRCFNRRDWTSLRELLAPDLRVVDHSKDPEAWERFLALEHSSWKGAWGTAFGSTARDAAFFRRMFL